MTQTEPEVVTPDTNFTKHFVHSDKITRPNTTHHFARVCEKLLKQPVDEHLGHRALVETHHFCLAQPVVMILVKIGEDS